MFKKNMKPFKFFQKENKSLFIRMTEGLEAYEVQRQLYAPLQLTREEQTINDAIRHEEYLHNIHVRESMVDWARMARDIQEQAQLRTMIDRPIEIPEEFQHRGRRPRNPF